MNATETKTMYEQLGISEEVWAYGQKIEDDLRERFRGFDETAEYNQLKVIRAMQENRGKRSLLQLCERLRLQ